MDIIKGKLTNQPWMGLVYATPGFGKSTWASQADSPLFLDLENGLKRIDCNRTPHLTTYSMFKDGLGFACTNDFKTIVVDSVDALEFLLIQKILDEEKGSKQSLGDFGYGKGYELLVANWSLVLGMFDRAKNEFNRNILLIGHEQIQRYEDPASDAYDRYALNIHKKSASLVISRCDFVFFGKDEAIIKKREGGMAEKGRGIGTGRKLLHTREAPAWVAKNRFNLPAEVELSPDVFNLLNQ